MENFLKHIKKFINFYNSYKDKNEFFKIELGYSIFRLYYSNYEEVVCYKISSKLQNQSIKSYRDIFEEEKQILLNNLILKIVDNLRNLYRTPIRGFEMKLFDFYSENDKSNLCKQLMIKSKIFNQALLLYIFEFSKSKTVKKLVSLLIQRMMVNDHCGLINIIKNHEDFSFHHLENRGPAIIFDLIKSLNQEFYVSFDQIVFYFTLKNIILHKFKNKIGIN